LSPLFLCAAACGGGTDAQDGGSTPRDTNDDGRPEVVVTTAILGDIVTEAFGAVADVEVVMPAGADPHEFAVSARQAETMERADLVVVNGRGLEAGMDDVIDAVAEGGHVFVASDHLSAADQDHIAGESHEEGESHEDGDGDDEDSDHDGEQGEDEHDHDGVDPHIWMDPMNIVAVVEALAFELDPLVDDEEALAASADDYVAELEALDQDIDHILASVPPERRVMVTNHDSFGLFAERYELEILGAVIPAMSTAADASAASLEQLADTIRESGVPVVFAETTHSARLADALVSEVGEVDGERVVVVELYSGGLGETGSGAETYLGMLRVDAELIAAAILRGSSEG
jgi:ABC-type Zn uptake system ZnuABC Zn-binding protein ZnuA